MCINLQTSIISFIIGELSGYYLFKQPENIKKAIGIFIMWFSIVQFIEALMYIFNERKILTQILSLFLSTQGLVVLLAYNDKSKWLHIMFLLTLILIYLSLFMNFVTPVNNTCSCLNWEFLEYNDNLVKGLKIMYILIFIWGFTRGNIYLFKYCFLLLLTFLFAYIIKPIKNSPSMWCLTSAIVSPIFLFIKL
jgi:hypothetical protein